MGATDRDRFPPTRRFITRHDVEDAARAGRALTVAPRDVVTHEAAQRARDLGVAIERSGTATPARPGPSGSPGVAAPSAPAPGGSAEEALRRAVRSAVVAELGSEPPGLDAAIARVLSSRRGT